MRDQPTIDLIDALLELVEAIDRRVRHIERAGEAGIAREAAALRKAALARIEDLKTQQAPGARTSAQGDGL